MRFTPPSALLRRFAFVLVSFIAAASQGFDAATECRWTETPPVIDGRPDEPAWRNAAEIRFNIPWTTPPQAPKTRTSARLLWDREFLYFFSDMEDAQLVVNTTNHDGRIWEGDVFELFFRPSTNHGGYYEFELNSANAILDCFFPRREPDGFERWKDAQQFHIESKIHVHAGGWSVEGRIPWTDFRPTGGRPTPGEEWRFTLCRYDYTPGAKPELSASAPLTAQDFHRIEDYARLRFIGPKMARRITWNNSRVVGSPDPPTGYRIERAYPGIEGKSLVAIGAEPGSQRILFLQQTQGWTGEMKLKRFRDAPDARDAETLLDLPDTAYGFAFHPRFAENGFIYIGCNGPAAKPPRFSRVLRYTMSREAPWNIDPASRKLIIEWSSDGHNGADLCFGADGMLYVTSGDGTSDSDGDNAGQNIASLRAKVLRIDVDHPGEGKAYTVPRDNPFVGDSRFAPETWAYGLRNPWRITFDRESGQLWVGENGQDAWESARLIQRGANYGWSVFEGSHRFRDDRELGPTPMTPPTIEHSHAEFRSLTGGVVYRGRLFPELRGAYLYGDFSTGRIWAALHNGQRLLWDRELVDTALAITGFGFDSAGEVLVADYGGGIYRLARDIKTNAVTQFPTRLSETGLFLDTSTLTPDPGLIPYDVNTPLWSDGAAKERFIALPADARIEWRSSGGWEFPDGAVLVKSFFLESDAGNPKSRRRLETRLLTKQQGDWVGYTYVWSEDQKDAVLLAKGGADREFTVRDANAPGGERRQVWHFPSRAECMMCHTRAANFVLGPTEGQFNKAHDYGNGLVENQLAHLERLGLFKVDALRDANERRSREGPPEDTRSNADIGKQRESSMERDWLLPRDPEHLDRLAALVDTTATVTLRARSYLAANCAICHVMAGGGNSALDLDFHTRTTNMLAVGVAPQHDAFGIGNGRIIAPGSPERSVLLRRVSLRGMGQMPPLGTTRVDEQAVAVLKEWIQTMR